MSGSTFKRQLLEIVDDYRCRKLKVDVDSYNQNRDLFTPTQVSFHFTADLAEIEAVGVG